VPLYQSVSGKFGFYYGTRNVTAGQPFPSYLEDYVFHKTLTKPDRRKRPLGIEIYFNGTNVSKNITSTATGRWFRSYTLFGNDYEEAGIIPAAKTGNSNSILIDGSSWATNLRVKLKDQSVNLAQAYAERKQAAVMFEDFGSRILKAYKALRKADVVGVYDALSGGKKLPRGWKKQFSRTAQQVGDHWLAWQYGVRPLISDIKGSIEEIYKVRSVQPLIRRVRVSIPERKVFFPGSGGLNPTTHKSSGYVVAYAEFNSGASSFDQTAQRLGLTDPLLLAWELIPYSFVIDWFLNVGSFIQATGTISGLKRIGISETAVYHTDAVNINAQYGGLATYTSIQKNRTFTTVLPGATLTFSKKPFGDLLGGNFDRVYSALALARQPLGTSSLVTKRGFG
jgi:hypothetical protein